MSSQNPPYPYFDGITYNSSFFSTSSSSGLTQSQANALYLKKTVSDIATASETFSGGILTSSVDTATPTVNYALLSGLTSGDLGIATNQTDGAVSIGNKASRIGDVNIGNGSSMAGKLNLGTGPSSTGIINIGTGAGSIGGIALGVAGNTTNIMGPLSSLSSVSLGSVGNTTNIYGALSSLLSVSLGSTTNTTAVNGILTVATGISTATIDTNSLTSNFSFINSLGASNTMGIGVLAPAIGSGPKTIQIGETTITSVHAGGIDCLGTTINGSVAPAGGDLSLASKQTTGTLNIGNYSGRTGIINIGAGMVATTNAVNIGTSLAPINIGTLSAGTAGIILGNATNGITTNGLLTASGGTTTTTITVSSAPTSATYNNNTSTFTATQIGQSAMVFQTANIIIGGASDSTVLNKMTIANTGIYSITTQAQFGASAVVSCTSALTWVVISAPVNLGQVCLSKAPITTAFNLQAFNIAGGGAWCGLITASATITQYAQIYYTGTANAGYCYGSSAFNLLTITRIA